MLQYREAEIKPRIWFLIHEYNSVLPLPMCRRVFSIVELRLTLESKPKQNLFLLLEGSVNPSTKTLVEDAWKASPTRLFNS